MHNGKQSLAPVPGAGTQQSETTELPENAVAKAVVNAAYKVHTQLGPGLLANFGASMIRDGITRVMNGLAE